MPLAQVIEVYDSFREALSPNRIVCEMSGALRLECPIFWDQTGPATIARLPSVSRRAFMGTLR